MNKMKTIFLRFLLVLFNLFILINALGQDMWVTKVTGTVKINSPVFFNDITMYVDDFNMTSPGTKYDSVDPKFTYSGVVLSSNKVSSFIFSLEGNYYFEGCGRDIFNSPLIILNSGGKSGYKKYAPDCPYEFTIRWNASAPEYTYEGYNKLAIEMDQFYSVNKGMSIKVKNLVNYPLTLGNVILQVGVVNPNNRSEVSWESRDLSILDLTKEDNLLTFDEINGTHDGNEWKGIELAIRLKQQNGVPYETERRFWFFDDLEIEVPNFTPDCPGTNKREGSLDITLKNPQKWANGTYPMCGTLYQVKLFNSIETCEAKVTVNNVDYCKEVVIAQGPTFKSTKLTTDTTCETTINKASFKIDSIGIAPKTTVNYLLEVYNGRFRMPAYKIITLKSNDVVGVPEEIPTKGTSTYNISSCNLTEIIGVKIKVTNSYGYNNTITENLSAGTTKVSIVDNLGCKASTSVTIKAPPEIFTFTKIQGNNAACNGGKGSITCTTSGGVSDFTYLVTKIDENNNIISTGSSLTDLSAGKYNVKVTDATGCNPLPDGKTIDISQPTPITFTVIPSGPECYNGSDGSLTFTPNGGTQNYTITVLDNATNNEFASYTGLTAGVAIPKGGYTGGKTYKVSIKDSKGCSGIEERIPIPNPPQLKFDELKLSKPSDCEASLNGEATFKVSNLFGRAPSFYNENNSIIPSEKLNITSDSSYLWTGLGVGTSQIKVKAGNCFSSLENVTINQKQDQISLTFDPSPADCETKDNGSINVNVLNGVLKSNEYTYVLTKESGISTTAETSDATYTFSSLQGNRTYSFSVTDGVGCVATAEKGVPLDPYRIQLNTPNSENTFCSANPSGKISVSRLSGSGYGDITYSLLDGDAIGTGDNDNYTFSGLVPGKYTVQALDNSNSCYATKTVDVIANPNPISIIFSDTIHQSCNEVTNGQMRITASSIGPNNSNYGIESIYNGTLNVKTESNTILYQNQEAVTYNFTVVDKNKCTATGAFQIKNLHNNPTLKVNSIDSLYCPNDKTGVIRFKLSQKWRKPAYNFFLNGVLNPTDSIFSNRSAKNDTILVVDAEGCPGDTIMNVPVLANTIRFSPNPYFTHASCMAAKNGTITVKADKGFPFENGNYKYSINTGETVLGKVAVFDSLEAGKDYVVSVSDAKDCILTYDQIPIRIIDNPLALSSPNTTNATCIEKATGRMIVSRLYGTPFKKGFKFDINDSTGTTVSTQNSGFSNVLFTGLKQGRYNVVVSDTNKCSVSQPFTIGYNPLFEVNSVKPFRVPKFGTRGGMVRAVASLGNAGFDYKFFQTGINGSTSAVLLRSGTMKDTVNIRNLYTGTYIIHIKDTADCVIDENTGNMWFIDTVAVSQPERELALQVSSLKNVACYGDSTASIQLSAQGGYPEYRYAIKEKVNFQREPLFGHLPIGTYELFVRDDADIDTSILVTVTQPSSPLTPSLAGTNRTSCFNYSDGKASLSITGGTSPYTVSLDSVRWQSDPVLVGLKANKYTALVKDANNCFARLPNIMVTQPDSIAVSSQTITSTPCLKNEGAINVTGVTGGNGDYSYVWYKKDSVLGNQSILSNLYSGRYKLRITDKDGCKGDTAFFVSDISNIWVNFNTTPINCWGKANGKAELTVVKGALPITSVVWPGKPISMFATTELDSGLHRVVITDNERCQKDTTFTINTISRLSIPEVWRNNPLCLGRSDGSLRVEAAGGNPGYSYNWGKYGSRNEITDLLPGIYNVSVTDANNCVRAFDLTLDYQKVEKPRLGRDLVLCSRSDYILNPGNYLQYNWTLNNKAISTDSVFVVTQPGTYVVNVKSDEQCLGSDTLNVYFSNEELVSDFLMTTQAYAGDTIMLVEISRPIPDSVTWVLSTGSKLIDYGQYFKQISLPDTGIYKYAMIAHYKGCSDMVEKYVEVISPDGSVSKKKSATDDLFNSVSVYPNPSSGQFTVEVVLKRKSDLLMKIINLGTGITKYIRSSKGSDVYTENFSLNLTPGMHVLYVQAGKSSRTVNIMVR